MLDRVERGNNYQNSHKSRQGNYSGVKACMKLHYNLDILGNEAFTEISRQILKTSCQIAGVNSYNLKKSLV